jgi:sugar/nucleoside kinase (ribokinase family)
VEHRAGENPGMRAVAVLGHLAIDRIEGSEPQPGGGPFHAARMLRVLQRPALLLVSSAAADKPLLLPPLVRLGIPVTWRESSATACFAMEYDGDRRRMIMDEIGDPWRPEDIAASRVLDDVGWAHVAPLARSDFPPETLAALARGRRLSLDGQGLVRPARKGPLELDADYDPAVLEHVSILKLAEEEAVALVGETGEQALRTLGVPEVIVTLGSRGSIVLADGLAEHVPARGIPTPDPTGAGDAFSAAYLVGRSNRLDPTAAARWASAAVAGLLSGRLR